jgi:hypothetical protein
MITNIGAGLSTPLTEGLPKCQPGSDALSFQQLLDGGDQLPETQSFSSMGVFGLARAVDAGEETLATMAVDPRAVENGAPVINAAESNYAQPNLVSVLLPITLAAETAQAPAHNGQIMIGETHVALNPAPVATMAPLVDAGEEGTLVEGPMRNGAALDKARPAPDSQQDAAFHLHITDEYASLALRLDQAPTDAERDRLRRDIESLLDEHQLSLASFKISGTEQSTDNSARGYKIWPSQA